MLETTIRETFIEKMNWKVTLVRLLRPLKYALRDYVSRIPRTNPDLLCDYANSVILNDTLYTMNRLKIHTLIILLRNLHFLVEQNNPYFSKLKLTVVLILLPLRSTLKVLM